MSTLINRRLIQIERQSERMKIKALDADCISFQTVVYVRFHLLSQGLVEQIGGDKLRIRINETDPAIQRNDLFVRRFLKRTSKFLRTVARSNGTFSRFFIDRMPFLSVRVVLTF